MSGKVLYLSGKRFVAFAGGSFARFTDYDNYP